MDLLLKKLTLNMSKQDDNKVDLSNFKCKLPSRDELILTDSPNHKAKFGQMIVRSFDGDLS